MPGEAAFIEFYNRDEYFEWLYTRFDSGKALYSAFTMTGCVNWVLQSDLSEIEELFQRYEMMSKFSIGSSMRFEEVPVNLMNGLCIIEKEFKEAMQHAQKGLNG